MSDQQPVPASLLAPPGTVVRGADDLRRPVYEPAVTGPGAPIPYEKQDRTPSALQHLEGLAVQVLNIDPQLLVSLRGIVTEHGSVATFGEKIHRGSADYRLYRVVSYDSRTGKFTHLSRYVGTHAAKLYDQRVEELS
jgi:hypothetical protein